MRKSGFIAIAGRPNAGKSTLLNRVLGSNVSIVTPKAQTTRERVLGILTEPQGQIVFIDTPGIHRAKEGGINAYMMSEVREALIDPSVIWYLVDPHSKLVHELPVLDLLRATDGKPVFLIVNKMDLKTPGTSLQAVLAFENELRAAALERGVKFEASYRISAEKGRQVDALLADSWALLEPGELFYPDEDQISDRPVRFFVAEKIREQLLLCLGDELPYSCAVQIEKFDESSKPPRIEATIHVERDSQKGMVIGKAGAKIKEIGQAARAEIEDFLGEQIFLGLKVKVLKDWSKDSDTLRKLGYAVPNQKGRSA